MDRLLSGALSPTATLCRGSLDKSGVPATQCAARLPRRGVGSSDQRAMISTPDRAGGCGPAGLGRRPPDAPRPVWTAPFGRLGAALEGSETLNAFRSPP